MAAEPSVAHFCISNSLGFTLEGDAIVVTPFYEVFLYRNKGYAVTLSHRTLAMDLQEVKMDYRKILEAVENHFKEL